MRFAVIDLGTNTFNLLIAEYASKNTFVKIFNTKIPVKLGEATINSGYISDKAFLRGIDALIQYKACIANYNVSHVYAFATSAIRTASNGLEFVKRAKKEAGISITVIDGNEEADLIYYGVRMATHMNQETSLIIDIGGGSTEFILANNTTIIWKQSFLLGAARLFEKFKLSDPITPTEINNFNFYLRQELKPLLEAAKHYNPVELIGSSGAFDSVVDMIAGEYNTTSTHDGETEYSVDLAQYFFISDKIKASTIAERYHIKGLIAMRVDMMVISVLLMDFVVKELQLNKMRVSTFALKEGVISKKLGLAMS